MDTFDFDDVLRGLIATVFDPCNACLLLLWKKVLSFNGWWVEVIFLSYWFWDWVCFFFNWGSWVGKDGEEMHVGEVGIKKR